jgi:hypothetical protein
LVRVAGTPLADTAALDPFDFVRTIAVARILMPRSHVRLSAGRSEMNDELQALCFLAGANSIFYGEKLLTTGNPDTAHDRQLFERLKITAEPPREPQINPSQGGSASRPSELRSATARPLARRKHFAHVSDQPSEYSLDKSWLRRSFDKASASYDSAAVLQAEVRDQLLERLNLTDLAPRLIVDAGAAPATPVAPSRSAIPAPWSSLWTSRSACCVPPAGSSPGSGPSPACAPMPNICRSRMAASI